jgi:hypothetical protein
MTSRALLGAAVAALVGLATPAGAEAAPHWVASWSGAQSDPGPLAASVALWCGCA